MEKLFFLLSGEHATLPFSELKAILKAEGYSYRILEEKIQAVSLETDISCVNALVSRAALTRVCSLQLFCCEASFPEIAKKMQQTSLQEFIEEGESFVVRVRKIRATAPHINSMWLEQKLGELILNKVEGIKVSLHFPEKIFFGLLTENKFFFGLKLAEISPTPFMNRKPRKKPFFHPSAMPPKLARCMVNLAQPRKGDLVFDPFCGTASILIEAGLIGCRVVGLDVQKRMIKGSLRNLFYFGVKPEGMIVGDARHVPVSKIDFVVTDPPYGRSASTMGSNTKQILKETLKNLKDKLSENGRICMAVPKAVRIRDLAKNFGFKPVESHFAYVHRSLTREVAVLENAD